MKIKSLLHRCIVHIFSLAALAVLFGSFASAANPVPTVTAPVHPQAVVPGRGGLTLTVHGANFVNGAVVNWNGSPRSTTFVSARELRAKILASDVVKPTAGHITVTNPAPGGGPSSSSYAIVEVHEPTSTIAPGPPHTYHLYELIEFLTPAAFHKEDTLDLLAGGGSGKVYLFTGNGDGTFTNKVVGDGYYSVYNCNLPVGDFNNDGKLDYIFPVGQYPNSAVVKVRLGNGKGSFRTSGKYGTFETCPDIVVGDFNEDAKLDFATADIGGGVHIFLGNGDGTLSAGEKLRYSWRIHSSGRGLQRRRKTGSGAWILFGHVVAARQWRWHVSRPANHFPNNSRLRLRFSACCERLQWRRKIGSGVLFS